MLLNNIQRLFTWYVSSADIMVSVAECASYLTIHRALHRSEYCRSDLCKRRRFVRTRAGIVKGPQGFQAMVTTLLALRMNYTYSCPNEVMQVVQ